MNDLFEKVRTEINIADVLERYGTRIDRSGKGLCPFHNDSIASDGTMTATFSGSGVTVTARQGLGNLTNLDDVLNYISRVFLGSQAVSMIKAGTFDTTS